MATLFLRTIRITAILVTLLLVGTASATAAGDAEGVSHRGVLKMDGALWALRVSEKNATQAPEVHVSAGDAYGVYYESLWVVANNGPLVPPAKETPVATASDPLKLVELDSLGSEPSFDIRVLPLADAPASLKGVLRGATGLAGLPSLDFNIGGAFKEAGGLSTDSDPSQSNQGWSTKTVDRPVVVSALSGGTTSLTIRGDFVVELLGPSVRLDSEGQEPIFYETGQDRTVIDERNYKAETHLLRLVFTGAELTLKHSGADGRLLQYATTETYVEGDGGSLRFEDPSDDLLGLLGGDASTRFTDGYMAALTPDENGRIQVEMQGRESSIAPTTTTTWTSPAGFNPLPLFLILAAVALAAFGARRLRPTPELAHMESALEAGAFARAVRLASRILRKNPDDESARLGRAIALSRIGRPERVVKDLEAYLAHNEPSDGTMHYVLGLAYRDLGKEDTARSRLSQAVLLTPALAQQVPGAQPPPRNAPVGDAQGYT